MATFAYEAIDQAGARVKGAVDAPTEAAAIELVEAKSLSPLRVTERAERTAFSLGNGVSARKLGRTYANLGDLLKAGVPLLRAIRLIARQNKGPLGDALEESAQLVSDGGALSEGFAKHDKLFPTAHLAVIRAGEASGSLDRVLSRLGRSVTAQAELQGKLIGNLVYPAILVVLGVLILVVIFAVFVPMLKPALDTQVQAGTLPAITKVLFAASDNAGIVLVLGFIAIVAAVATLRNAKARRWSFEKVSLAPVIGGVLRAVAAARFCRTLGEMLASGVNLLQAIAIAKESASNPLLERVVDRVAESVRAGQPLAQHLGDDGVFPPDVVEMVRVGEEAGTVDEVLIATADTLDDRVDRLLSTATKLVEPLMLVLIAGVVLVVALGLLLPLFSLGDALS